MKRKVIRQGNNTLTITLPRTWTNNLKINAGDEIDVGIDGSTLIISTDKLISYGRKSRDISKLTSILPLILLTFYRKGYDEIDLRFEKPHTSIIIQNILRDGLTGYHIIDHKKNSCLLRALSDINDMDFNEILRKLFILIKIKLEKITEAILKKDISELQSLIAMSTMPSKMTNFCYRLLSKRNLAESDKISYFQIIVSNLENLDNQLNLLINILSDTSVVLNSVQLFDCIHEFRQLYCDFYAGYYNPDLHKFVSLLNRKNILVEKLMTFENLSKDENRLFLNLNNSFIYFNEIVNTALVLGL